jgi:hypothetical protein
MKMSDASERVKHPNALIFPKLISMESTATISALPTATPMGISMKFAGVNCTGGTLVFARVRSSCEVAETADDFNNCNNFATDNPYVFYSTKSICVNATSSPNALKIVQDEVHVR